MLDQTTHSTTTWYAVGKGVPVRVLSGSLELKATQALMNGAPI